MHSNRHPVASAAVRSKVLVLLMLMPCLLILLLCVGVLCLVFVMHFLVLQQSRCGRESWLAASCCHVVISILSLFLIVPWVGLKCVIVTFPGNTHLPF